MIDENVGVDIILKYNLPKESLLTKAEVDAIIMRNIERAYRRAAIDLAILDTTKLNRIIQLCLRGN